MKIWEEPVQFDWDKGNIGKNLKHNVKDKESEEVFDNDPKFNFEDEKHSLSEKRYMLWGITNNGRRLSIFFTIRTGKIRIISARDMHKKERREYEKKNSRKYQSLKMKTRSVIFGPLQIVVNTLTGPKEKG